VRVLVYRGGALAAMGHNHVLTVSDLAGYIWRDPRPADSGFDLVVPVGELIVDDDQARTVAGTDFPLNVTAAAKRGTRDNMRSEAVLDAAHFPFIRLRSVHVRAQAGIFQVQVALQIKDQTRELELPVTLVEAAGQLRVSGEFEIRQSDFGITPFSVAMGALRVLDNVTVRFDLVGIAPP
jgi:polyisoprenoid-binding protein YceI